MKKGAGRCTSRAAREILHGAVVKGSEGCPLRTLTEHLLFWDLAIYDVSRKE
jgi:hypothetical protein